LFGEKNELSVMGVIEKLTGEKMVRQGGFNIMDFRNENHTIYAELKSRTIPSTKFDTAIVGKNKVEFCNDPTKTYYFVFCYTDGLFYIKYDKDLFNTFQERDDYYRTERADCVNKAQRVILIPRGLLTKL